MAGDERFIVGLGCFQRGQQGLVFAVGGGDSQVALIAAPFGALERTVFEFLVEFLGSQAQIGGDGWER